jgi:hypothetical protein
MAFAKHLQKRHLYEPGRIRVIGNASALSLGELIQGIGEAIKEQIRSEHLRIR